MKKCAAEKNSTKIDRKLIFYMHGMYCKLAKMLHAEMTFDIQKFISKAPLV